MEGKEGKRSERSEPKLEPKDVSLGLSVFRLFDILLGEDSILVAAVGCLSGRNDEDDNFVNNMNSISKNLRQLVRMRTCR